MSDLAVVPQAARPVIPAVIPVAGERAALRSATGTRGPLTRGAAADFLGWCEEKDIKELRRVQPVHVATYVSTVVGLRPRHHRRDGIDLRPRPARRCAHSRGLLSQKKRWWLRLHEKNGKLNEMPCHHQLEGYLDAYIKAAGIESDRKRPLFRSALGKTAQLSARPMLRSDVWRMVRRRASEAGIETAIGCHAFRATGVTDYLTNGGRIQLAQRMAGHSNAKTTGIYDRRNDDVSVGDVERIGI